MSHQINRRRALVTLGGVSLGALTAAACGDDDGDEASQETDPTTTSTTSGDTATTTGSGTSTGLADRFENASSCSLTPEAIEGPYYIDVDALRRDIRDGQEGTPLRLGIRVLDEQCTPLTDALVEVWHCNALGIYSGFEAESEAANEGPGGAPGLQAPDQTDDTRYLRGGQLTDPDGIAEFLTIYPGWYRGRTVHVHVKAHLDNTAVLTTQLYFDDELSDAAFALAPYSSHPDRETLNDDDGLFLPETILTLTEESDGYLGVITLNVAR